MCVLYWILARLSSAFEAGDMPIEPRSGSAKIICATVVQSHALVNAGPRLALGTKYAHDNYQTTRILD
jgi:hypothetical protein